ncbi:MAG: hypothetical protein QXG98_00275 [Candidatus Micrarchaeia archaeon]
MTREISELALQEARTVAKEAHSFLTDIDVVVLLLWSLISPAAGLAYIVWVRYPRLRLLAIPPLILVSVIQLLLQWSWVIYFLLRALRAPPLPP